MSPADEETRRLLETADLVGNRHIPLAFPVLSIELRGMKQSMLHALGTHHQEIRDAMEKAIDEFKLAEAVGEQVKRGIEEAVRDEVRRRLAAVAHQLVEKAIGNNRYMKTLEKLEKRLRREALLVWQEEFEP